MTDRILTCSRLTINLANVRANYRKVLEQVDGIPAAAMVKANGYGLGAAEISVTLSKVGCTHFFVAQLSEAVAVRDVLPTVSISVLNGVMPGTEEELVLHNLTPVLNSIEQLTRWRTHGRTIGRQLEATLHVDTGMRRLGLGDDETRALIEDPSILDGIDLRHLMSHLASADVPDSPQPAQQLRSFRHLYQRVQERHPSMTASLANSAGIFLDPSYHFDLVRPGIALYGGTPLSDGTNPMQSVVTLEAPIIQVRNVIEGDTVGYGATHCMSRDGRIATVALGYADGFLRSGSGSAQVHLAGRHVPIIGRISMDLVTIDVSEIEAEFLYPGSPVEFIGPHCGIDDVAERAGTIANELLTDLGHRYERVYQEM